MFGDYVQGKAKVSQQKNKCFLVPLSNSHSLSLSFLAIRDKSPQLFKYKFVEKARNCSINNEATGIYGSRKCSTYKWPLLISMCYMCLSPTNAIGIHGNSVYACPAMSLPLVVVVKAVEMSQP